MVVEIKAVEEKAGMMICFFFYFLLHCWFTTIVKNSRRVRNIFEAKIGQNLFSMLRSCQSEL